MPCAVCARGEPESGVLCADCRDGLSVPPFLIPEQVQAATSSSPLATLIDPWGRPHGVDRRMLIGRQVPGYGMAILEGSVSRQHAHLAVDPAGVWRIRDLGSANGTTLDEQAITDSTLADKQKIGIGLVEFYFVQRADLARETFQPIANVTVRRPARDVSAPSEHTDTSGEVAHTAPSASFGDHVVAASDFSSEEPTGSGVASTSIEIHEPTGGGGGVVVVDGRRVQLGQVQLELFRLLYERMVTERDLAEAVRGFVRSSELVGALSWEAVIPDENNVKQVVRRTRRALIKGEIGDLIESRYRFGYRLRVLPRP